MKETLSGFFYFFISELACSINTLSTANYQEVGVLSPYNHCEIERGKLVREMHIW